MPISTGGASGETGRVSLTLSEPGETDFTAAPWIGPIVALGGMARRFADQLVERQLVIVLSVPRRDFAAVLLACGWVISAPEPQLVPVAALLDSLEPGTPVRASTAEHIFEDHFDRIEPGPHPIARFRKWTWMASHLVAAIRLSEPIEPRRSPVPPPGALASWKGLGRTWHSRLVARDPDVAIVGTASRLLADLEARVTARPAESSGGTPTSSPADSIGHLLLPHGVGAISQTTSIRSAAHLADESSLASGTQAVILDGYGAIKYLHDIEAPFVFCILDRSVADESSADLLMQYRNTRGEPVSLAEAIGWRPPAGVEALAFTTRL